MGDPDLTNRSDYDAFAASVASLPQVRPDTPGLSTADIEEAIKLWLDAAEQRPPLPLLWSPRQLSPAGPLPRAADPARPRGKDGAAAGEGPQVRAGSG